MTSRQQSQPRSGTNTIEIHSAGDFDGMRKAGRLAALVLDEVTPHVDMGVSTDALDKLCDAVMRDHGAVPATLGYRGYPRSSCISLNHVICHGIPGERRLQNGDILNIDVTVILDGWYGDTSRMFLVGDKVPLKARRLVDVTYDAMMKGIAAIRPGATLGDVGHAIQTHVEAFRFSVVRDFCGHGLGRVFHAPPSVLHFGRPGEGVALRPGMFFTVEPMVNAGRPEAKILSDGWTAVTRDRSLSAQFEHSIAVTDDGVEIFTQSPAGLTKPPYLTPADTPSLVAANRS